MVLYFNLCYIHFFKELQIYLALKNKANLRDLKAATGL